MKLTGFLLAGLAAVAVPATAQAPAKPVPQLDPREVSSAVRYAMPLALQGVYSTCGAALPAQGYLRSNRADLTTRFAQASEGQWSGARSVIMQFMDREGGNDVSFMRDMPDDALKPFVDAMVTQLVAKEIKPAQCTDIERIMEQLDPLPAENLANLMGVVIDLALKDDRAKLAAKP